MRAEIVYRQVVVSDRGKELLQVPVTAPTSDLLGLERLDIHSYLMWLYGRYEPFARKGQLAGDETPDLLRAFGAAAAKAAKGLLAVEIAPHLERVRFLPDGAVELNDFPALAAWSLLETIRRQAVKPRTCPSCNALWLGTPNGPEYCLRVAPGGNRDCRTLATERRLASDTDYSAYRRWYRRQNEAYRRGTMSPTAWSALKAGLARMSPTERLTFALTHPELAKHLPTEADLIRALTSEPKPRRAPTRRAGKEK